MVDTYSHVGTAPWRGTDVIQDCYEVERPRDDETFQSKRMPSAMLMRGGMNMILRLKNVLWGGRRCSIIHVRLKVLDGCSRHGLLENGGDYREIVDLFSFNSLHNDQSMAAIITIRMK